MLLLGRYRRPCDGAAHGSAVYIMEFVTADGFLKDLRPDPEDRISGVDLIWIFSEMKRKRLSSRPPFPNTPIYRSSQKHRESPHRLPRWSGWKRNVRAARPAFQPRVNDAPALMSSTDNLVND